MNKVSGTKGYQKELKELTEQVRIKQLQLIRCGKYLEEFTPGFVKAVSKTGNSTKVVQNQEPKKTKMVVKPVSEEKLAKRKTIKDKFKEFSSDEITFQLFQTGKTIVAIAEERGMAVSTVEGHLAQLVKKGLLSAEQFLSKEKIARIQTQASQLEEQRLSSLKEIFGDEFSWMELKIALSGMESQSS